ncbi:MAG: IS1380 family transposase [Bacteroidetes bacterium]|nr:IS1380 family transposase [Bacteroidota bacterium]
MTNCTPKTLSFSPLGRHQITGSFSGGSITSDGGLLLLREVDKRLKLSKRLSKCIVDLRDPAYIEHTIEDMLKQRIYAIAAGYEDVSDHNFLREDLSFQTVVNRTQALASAPTLSRLENAVTRRDCVTLGKEMVEQFIRNQKTIPKELTLDFDPTDYRLHGHQEKRHYHGYYESYCYLPLYVFCGDQLLVSYLRSSNEDGALHAGAILKLLVKRFREVWPNVKILFRGDCAFSRKRILHWCERNHVDYVVGFAQNKRLLKQVEALAKTTETAFEMTQEKQRCFTELYYAAESWNHPRRIICKVEHHEKGSNIRFLITNLKEVPQEVYDKLYCPRGDMENQIKQQKLDLFAQRVSCSDFIANQFRVLLSGFAYILLSSLRTHGLSATELATSYCQTIRNKLFKIGAIVIKNTRRIQYLFSSYCPAQDIFRIATQRLVSS